ncbi:Histidine ammonia-lyase [compost metagenome]
MLENCTQVLAIEYLLAAQAFEFLKTQRFGAGTDAAWQLLREQVPAYLEDRWLAPDIARAAELLKQPQLLQRVLTTLH